MNDTNRAEFEAWNPIRGNVRNAERDYVDSVRQAQWEGWQAARTQPERVALSKTSPCHNCMDTRIEHGVYANTECQFCKDAAPVTQPLIAEAARDDADSQMAMVGTCLAHVALNYSQRIGHTLESDDCTLLRKLHDQWVSAIASTPRKTGNPVMATRDDPFLINGQPLYDADLSLVCDYLTHETAFNGAAILAGWSELKRRAMAAVKRDDVAGDARDAERYRWLRERQWNDSNLFVVSGASSQVRLGTYCPSLGLLDAAIDAAIAASKAAQ